MASTSKSKHNTNCCVFGCHSRKGADRNIHFHYFPKRNSSVKVSLLNNSGAREVLDRRKAWERVLLMGKPVTDSMRVCSKHFKPDDYCAKGVKLAKPKLTIYAVPSLNLPADLLKAQPLYLTGTKKQEHPDLREEHLDMKQEFRDHQYSRLSDDESICVQKSQQKLDQQLVSEEITVQLNMDSTDSEDEKFLIKINNIENVIVKGEPVSESAVQGRKLLRHHIRYFTAKDMTDPVEAKRFRELAIQMLANKDQTITALQRKVRKLERQLALEKIKQRVSSIEINDFL